MNVNQIENAKANIIKLVREEQLDIEVTKSIIRKMNYQVEPKKSAKRSHQKDLSIMHISLEEIILILNSNITEEELENAYMELIKTKVMLKSFKGGMGIIEESK